MQKENEEALEFKHLQYKTGKNVHGYIFTITIIIIGFEFLTNLLINHKTFIILDSFL